MPPDPTSSRETMKAEARRGRQRLTLHGELTLALFPTVMILAVLWTVEELADERVLFSALASSAFLIYLDPMHASNSVRAVTASHLVGAFVGMGAAWVLGHSYGAAGLAMVVTILIMVVANIVHPPAIGTTLSFAYRSGLSSNITLFMLALGMIVALVILQRVIQYVLVRLTTHALH